jgi:hypothetical protein
MACEKLAKAYRLRDLDAEVDDLTTKYVGFATFINAFLRSPPLLKEYKGSRAAHQAICKSAAAIARAIEGLAPAIGKLHSPANAE